MSTQRSINGARHSEFYEHPVYNTRYGAAGASKQRPWQGRLLALTSMLFVVVLMSLSGKFAMVHNSKQINVQHQLEQLQEQHVLLQQLQQQLQQLLQQQQMRHDLRSSAVLSQANYQCSRYASTPFPVNIWYVKAPKAGSSTLTSIFNHICTRYGMVWLKEYETALIQAKAYIGPTQWNSSSEAMLSEVVNRLHANIDNYYMAMTSHMPYTDGAAAAAFTQPLWLFSSVRHPVPRLYSHYVQDTLILAAKSLGWDQTVADMTLHPDNFDFNATLWDHAMKNDTLQTRWEYAKKKVAKNFLYGYLRGSAITPQQVLDQYKFVFVVERMDESLVLFMLEFGLTYADVAYLPLKQRVGKYKTDKDMPDELNKFILSNNDMDVKLWELANARLNQTRQQLEQRCGVATVTTALQTFKQLLAAIVDQCITKADDWYQANSYLNWFNHTGMRTANVASISGEGYRCVRHVVRTFVGQVL